MKKIFFFTFLLLVPLSLLNAQVLDESFGTNGKVISEFSQSIDGIYTTVLQSDGKIIASGLINGYLAMARYHDDGSLDTTFGTDGKVSTSIRNGFFSFLGGNSDIKLQSDGKIVVLGLNTVGNTSEIIITRYHNNGTLDTAFGTNGKVNLNTLFSFTTSTMCNALRCLPDGKFIITAFNQFDEIYLIRCHNNGTPDNTFGTNGLVTTPVPDGYFAPYSTRDLYVQPNGKILVAVYMGNAASNNNDFSLFQYHTNGTLDTSFGTNGLVVTDMGSIDDDPRTIKVQPDGKIVVSGTANTKFAVARYTPSGILDTSFNGTDINTTTIGASSYCTDMILEADGKILLTGNIINDFGVVRYNANGTLDTTFGNNGKYAIDFGNSYDYGRAIQRQLDGKYVVGGITSYFCANRAYALLRFNLPNLTVAE